jgi:hypothetical protein
MVKRLFLTFAMIATTTAAVLAQSSAKQSPAPQQAEVLVLGTYHMANHNRDIYNMQADDVLSPKRQAEMAQLIEVLKKFHPTKIAIEADLYGPTNPTTLQRPNEYTEYVAGKRELGRDEIEQIGFRLAKELGHKTIYPVNADYDFPYPRVVDYAKANGRSQELDQVMDGFNQKTKAQGEYLATHTILETLLYMNADEKPVYEMGLYYRLARFGDVGDWAGGDLIADWFHRNIRIYSNILKLVDSPNERVLVIYGSGHLGWLQQDFASNPDIKLRKLAEFAK